MLIREYGLDSTEIMCVSRKNGSGVTCASKVYVYWEGSQG